MARIGLGAFILLILGLAWARPAEAVPSFAEQTGLPCATCHVGAFGPQLKPFGRQFKLNGYTLSNGESHLPPLSAELKTSFTHDSGGRPGGAGSGFGQTACAACHPGQFGTGHNARNNLAADSVSLYFAGRVTDHIGAFVQGTFNGISNDLHWDSMDIRYANTIPLAAKDLVFGVTVNNNPTVQDLWNTTPQWTFPFAQSGFAPSPAAATLIDGSLAQTVIGSGIYTEWDNLLYLEVDAYHDIGVDARRSLGIVPASGQNTLRGLAPYWRAALEDTEGPHSFELGTYGISAKIFPTDVRTFGADRFTDVAFDAQYQYIPSDDFNIGAYATWINERLRLDASRFLIGAQPSDRLRTWRANVSVSFQDTYTLNARYFKTMGSQDPVIFGTSTGSPNSAGWIGEVDWAPNGKVGGVSYLPSWLNVKLSLQYVAYTRFDGTTVNAAENNAIYALAWFAVPFN